MIRSEFGFITIMNLLDYAYTGQLTISNTNVQDLVLGAQYLGMVRTRNLEYFVHEIH